MGSFGWREDAVEVLAIPLQLRSNALLEDLRGGTSTVLHKLCILKYVLLGLVPSSEVIIRPIVAPMRTETLRLWVLVDRCPTSVLVIHWLAAFARRTAAVRLPFRLNGLEMS